jgi:hypothetical protein
MARYEYGEEQKGLTSPLYDYRSRLFQTKSEMRRAKRQQADLDNAASYLNSLHEHNRFDRTPKLVKANKS